MEGKILICWFIKRILLDGLRNVIMNIINKFIATIS